MTASGPRTRISDADRERAMADLAGHYADGRLDHEEYDERLDAIWTARTRGDLAILFSDMPRPVAPEVVRTPARRAEAAVPAGARAAHRTEHPLRGAGVAVDLPADVLHGAPARDGVRSVARSPRLPAAAGVARLVTG